MTDAAETTPAVADLLARARVYVEGSHAKQTLEAYAADWKHFTPQPRVFDFPMQERAPRSARSKLTSIEFIHNKKIWLPNAIRSSAVCETIWLPNAAKSNTRSYCA